ncbi:MAG: exodeoxyribonuclease VII large subunit [Acidobacteria bacterium]|nr:exodeoxyribonuclease VII large subunit [Acidobacteriota bacterium]
MEKTYRISEFASEVRSALRAHLPAAWLSGEVQRLRRSGRGHLYFELVEKGPRDDVLAKLEAVIWRSDLETIEQELAKSDQHLVEGVEIRCRAEVDFYAPFGRLQIVVRRVDPGFTLGLLSKRRRETLEALRRSGFLERNQSLELSEVPLRVGLITSFDSAAYHDFVSTLEQSGYGFRVEFLHSAVQGREAESELATALRRARSLEIDCLVMIRGGGSRTDLAVFDSRRVAEELAQARVPVITGLGHEIDQAVADLVAHTRTKTPTHAAEFLAARVRSSDTRLAELAARVVRSARAPLAGMRTSLRELSREFSRARYQVSAGASRLQALLRRLRASSGARLVAAAGRSEAKRSQLRAVATVRVHEAESRIDQLFVRASRSTRADLRRQRTHFANLERLCRQLSPERTLRRGFSITRGEDGKVLRAAAQAVPGSCLRTQLADGVIKSRVEPQ